MIPVHIDDEAWTWRWHRETAAVRAARLPSPVRINHPTLRSYR